MRKLMFLFAFTSAAAWAQDPATTGEIATPASGPVASDAAVATLPSTEAPSVATGRVARSAFTIGVENHEPVDNILSLANDRDRVFYFTELRGMNGQVATHRWTYNGEIMAEVQFQVAGPRWRVWSSKNLQPGWTGEWRVEVLNAQGDVLTQDSFQYTPINNQTATP